MNIIDLAAKGDFNGVQEAIQRGVNVNIKDWVSEKQVIKTHDVMLLYY